MYLIISIFLIISLSSFLLISKLKKIKKKYSDFIDFILTISATFIGVFIALYFSRIDAEKLEKENVSKLLLASAENLAQTREQIGVFYLGLADTSEINRDYSKFTDRSPRPFPELFEKVLNNEMVLRYMSKTSLRSLTTSFINLRKVLNIINHADASNNAIKLNTDVYGRELKHTEQIIYSELAYLKKEISLDDLITLQQKFHYELLGKTPIEFNRAIKSANNKFDWKNLGK